MPTHKDTINTVVASIQLRDVTTSINTRLSIFKTYLAQKKFYDEHYSFIYNICRKYVRSDRECRSITNEVVRRVLKKDLSSIENQRGYLRRTCVNACIDHLKSKNKYDLQHTDIEIVEEFSEEPTIIDKLSYDDILEMIGRLPENQKTIFCLSVIDGYNSTEIGDLLGIKPGTCRWVLSQSKQNLKKIISNHYDRS